jgi:hypothetical protein
VLVLGVVVLLVLLVVAGVVLVRDRTARRWAAAEAAARWEDAVQTGAGSTRVVVRRVARLPSGEERVLGESVVAEVPDGAPDWHERFDAARQVAYDRALDLNVRPYLG